MRRRCATRKLLFHLRRVFLARREDRQHCTDGDLVALRHRNRAHVVAEARDRERLRLVPAPRRARPRTDALQYSGYQNALNVLRGLPAIGTIGVESRTVDIKFAYETVTDAGRRLVLVADLPLFFLSTTPDKTRAGYELTAVDLLFDKAGHATGTMSGAARVKPAGDGNIAMTDFSDAPMQVTVR